MNDPVPEVVAALLESSTRLEVLGQFDPLDRRLTFDERYMPGLNTPPDLDVPRTTGGHSLAHLLRSVPVSLLAHELAHWYQFASTVVGLRVLILCHQMIDRNHTAVLKAHALFGAQGRPLPLRLHDAATADEGLGESILAAKRTLNEYELNVGGRQFPLHLLNEFLDPAFDNSGFVKKFRADKDADEDAALYLLDLSVYEPKAERAVLLGSWHLFEGYSALVEALREIRNPLLDPAEAGSILQIDRPGNPYRVVIDMYNGMLPDRVTEASGMWFFELLLALDTALMSDAWIVMLDSRQAPTTRLLPFNQFLAMLGAMQKNDGLRLHGPLSLENRCAFQNALLEAVGAPFTDVRRITEVLQASCPPLLDSMERVRPLVPRERDAFLRALSDRMRFGGGCPVGLLAFDDREVLENTVAEALTFTFGSVITLDSDPYPELFAMTYRQQADRISHELVFGPQPCRFKSTCHLARRPACEGLTRDLRPPGARCAREACIQDILGPAVGVGRDA